MGRWGELSRKGSCYDSSSEKWEEETEQDSWVQEEYGWWGRGEEREAPWRGREREDEGGSEEWDREELDGGWGGSGGGGGGDEAGFARAVGVAWVVMALAWVLKMVVK